MPSSKGVPALMTHEQRRQLIEAPLGIRSIGGKVWGGTYPKVYTGPLGGTHPTHRYTGKYDNDGRAGQED